MYVDRAKRIIANNLVFLEDFQPDLPLGRRRQVKEIMSCLAPATRGDKPVSVWAYGASGTGKTATSKCLLGKLAREFGVRGSYVNCWEHDSSFSVLDALITDLRILRAEQHDTKVKLERLRTCLSDSPFVIVLDEIDKPRPRQRQDILYSLSTLGKVGLVCISGSRGTYFQLEERIKSRLNPRPVRFQPYQHDDIIRILTTRAEKGLEAGSWTEAALERIARLASGDARLAIQSLKTAAEAAVQEGAVKITPGFVEKGWHSAKEVNKSWILRNMTEDHRILHRLIGRRKEILSGDLWQFYCDYCSAAGKTPIASRTFSDYVNDLARARLIETGRAKVKGRVRLFRIIR